MMRFLLGLLLAARLTAAAAVQANEPPPGIAWQGEFVQGGMVIGMAQPGVMLKLGERSVPVARSEERRGGKGWVSTCRSRGEPSHKKKKHNNNARTKTQI